MKNLFRWIYHSEYPSDHTKRYWICGIRKTVTLKLGDKIRANYAKTLMRLKEKYQRHEVLNVCFLVAESAKWQFQFLYDIMEKSSDFHPFVVVVPSHDSLDEVALYKDVYHFFKARKIRMYDGYSFEKEKYIPLSCFNTDIVFYQQPWGISFEQGLYKTSQTALCCYVPYAIVENEWSYQKIEHFINNLFFHFVVDDSVVQVYNDCHMNTKPCVVTGHPKLDFALDVITNYHKKSSQKTVIYAPHHSFDKASFRWATFEWSGKAILAFAQQHPEINWVLKPHPRFKIALLKSKIMTPEQLDDYFSEWQKIGSIVTEGNYFELFAESDLLITDCGSFLAEYFLTQKPVIHLMQDASYPHHPYNQKFADTYYGVYNVSQMNQCLNDILFENKDILKSRRADLYHKLNYGRATDNIMTAIYNILKSGENK